MPDYAKFEQAFRKAPQIATEEMGALIQRVAVQIENDAKKFAPVNKQSGGGNLRQSIRSRPTSKVSAVVEATAKYASYVEGGTRPHIIQARNKKALANKKTGQFFGKTVRHTGTKAQPFLGKAVEKNQGWFNKQMLETANLIINKMFR